MSAIASTADEIPNDPSRRVGDNENAERFRFEMKYAPSLTDRPGTAFGSSAIGLLGATPYADFRSSDLDVFAKARRRPLGDESTTWMLCLASCHTYYSRNSGLATVRSQANFE